MSGTPRLSPTGSRPSPMKSPLRQVHGGAVTKRYKMVTIENLNLEITERVRKQRSLYEAQGRLLKERIEMRIHRVPKHFWKVTMGELLAQAEGQLSASSMREVGSSSQADARSQSRGETVDAKSERIVVTKKRIVPAKKAQSTREHMPPPPLPRAPSPTKQSMIPPSSLQRPASPVKSLPAKPARAKKTTTATTSSAASARGGARSRATARSSTETLATSGNVTDGYTSGMRGTKSSQSRAKSATESVATKKSAAPGLKRGGAGGTGSNGSLKENKVAGVRETTAQKEAAKEEKTTRTGRVLRSRR